MFEIFLILHKLFKTPSKTNKMKHYFLTNFVVLILGINLTLKAQSGTGPIHDLPDAPTAQGSTGGYYTGPQIYPQGGFRSLDEQLFIKIGVADPTPCSSISAGIQSGRIFRDRSSTSCPNETYPGLFNSSTSYGYTSVLFKNSGLSSVCLTVNFDPYTGANPCGFNGHAAIYQSAGGDNLSPYNPSNQAANYIGDVGSSETLPFSVSVEPGYFEIVFHNNSNISQCDLAFSFSTEEMNMISQSTRSPQQPQVSAITQATCNPITGGTVNLTGLPSGSWVLQQTGSGGVTTYSGSGESFTVPGLSPGVYRFSVNSSGCTSGETGAFDTIIVQY